MWVCPQVSLWEIQTRIMPLSSFASHHADGRNRTCIAFQCVPPLWFGQESNAGLIMSGVCVCQSDGISRDGKCVSCCPGWQPRRRRCWQSMWCGTHWQLQEEEAEVCVCVCVCVWLYTLACIAKLNSNKQVIWLYNRITKRNCNEVGLQ